MKKELEQASGLIRQKKMQEARKVLETFLRENPADMEAWWLYSETWPDHANKKRTWEYCLRFNPQSEEAQRALATINKEIQNGTPPPAPNIEKKRRPQRRVSLVFVIFAGSALLLVGYLIFLMGSRLIIQADDPRPYRRLNHIEYYLYVPPNYTPDKTWPVFVGIHGSGGTGRDCWEMWQGYARLEGFFLICPSISGDAYGYDMDIGEKTVWLALNDVQANYRVNPRVFMAGFSAGAYFVQGFAADYPQYITGVAILATGYYYSEFVPRVPVFIAIGEADHPNSIFVNRIMVQHLQGQGSNVEFVTYPLLGHTYNDDERRRTVDLFKRVSGK